jgi:hypothetical protein
MWRVALTLVLAVHTVSADPPARPACNAEAFEKEGDDALAKGYLAMALAKYDTAVRCEVAEKRVLKAGLAACALFRHDHSETTAKRAKRYYDMLREQSNKDKLATACQPSCRLE